MCSGGWKEFSRISPLELEQSLQHTNLSTFLTQQLIWSLLLLSTNFVSFLKLPYATNIPLSKFQELPLGSNNCEHAQYKDLKRGAYQSAISGVAMAVLAVPSPMALQ